ncbi:MAG: DUF2304 domain-containing protein [Thermoleophilaceae bacterium]|jgi:hypothetical protein
MIIDRIGLFSVGVALLLLLTVLELVRQRRLLERYAILWLFSAAVLLGFAVWKGLLDRVAAVIGIAYPPTALFVIAGGFVFILLLHFSAAVSRLADQSKVLAQRNALLEERTRRLEAALAATASALEEERRVEPSAPAAADGEPARVTPLRRRTGRR